METVMGDSNDLNRFLKAQEDSYDIALAEIKAGKKRSHWMWYIFPQLKGLGFSSRTQFYGIKDLQEAKAYLQHPVLARRLREVSQALLELPNSDAYRIFGTPDDLKLRSCMTLFAEADPEESSVFNQVLNKFFDGVKDPRTLEKLHS